MYNSDERREFNMGAYKSLSLAQFGSRRLDGGDLNTPLHQAADIAVGMDHERPLALKADTYGSANATMAWRKNGVLPYTKRTQGSTFSFTD